MSTTDKLLHTSEAAHLLRLSKRTLENWRRFGHGPAFLKMGNNKRSRVRYRLSELQRYATELQSTGSEIEFTLDYSAKRAEARDQSFMNEDSINKTHPDGECPPHPLCLIDNLRKLDLFRDAKQRAIYFLLDDQNVVYIGQTHCLAARICQHYYEGRKKFNAVWFLPVADADTRKNTEKEFINMFSPHHNYAESKLYKSRPKFVPGLVASRIAWINERLNTNSDYVSGA